MNDLSYGMEYTPKRLCMVARAWFCIVTHIGGSSFSKATGVAFPILSGWESRDWSKKDLVFFLKLLQKRVPFIHEGVTLL